VWPADFLQRTHASLSRHHRAVAASCDRRSIGPGGSWEPVQDCAPLAAHPCLWMLEHGAGIGSSTLFRHSAVAKRGGFNTSLLTGEDAALFLRVSLDGPWRHVAGAPVHFRRDLCQRDEGNKSQKYRDCFLQWAKMFEEFFA